MVLEREDASSSRPPGSQNDTVRFRVGDVEASLASGGSSGRAVSAGSTAVFGSDSELSRLLSECEPGK
jgi:hypothetical protein